MRRRFHIDLTSFVRFALASLLVLGWPAAAAAQCDVSWNNPAGGPWETATNWSPPAVPTAGQNTCIVLNGTYTVVLNSNRTVASLIIGGGAGVPTLIIQSFNNNDVSLTATNNVSNLGILTLENLGFSSDATLTSTNGTIRNLAGSTLNFLAGGGTRFLSGNLENDGTVNVKVQTTFSKPDGQAVNRGLFAVDPVGKFTMSSAAQRFSQEGGTLTTANALEIRNGTFAFAGGAVDGVKPIDIRNATLIFGVGGTDPSVYDITGAVTLVGNISAGQTLNLIGGGSGAVTLTSTTSFSNGGTITLDNPFGGFSPGAQTIVVTSGTLTNAPTGVITILAGATDSRFIRADSIVNNGTVNVNRSLIFDRVGGQYTNNATWNIAAGGGQGIRLAIQGAGAAFAQNGGTLTVNNPLEITAGTSFSYNGGAIGGAPQTPIKLTTASLVFGAGGTGAASFDINGSCTLTGNVSTGQTLNLIGGGSGAVTLTSATSFSNGGTIILDNPFGGFTPGSMTLVVTPGTLTNGPTGVITTRGSDTRTIKADLVNNGTITAERSLVLDKVNGQYTNNGTITVSPGGGQGITIQILGPGVLFLQNGGALNVNNPFDLRDGTFTYNAGAITGTVDLSRSRLNLTPTGTSAATFRMKGSSTMSGDIRAGQTVRIANDDATASATLTPVAGFTNQGTIVLESLTTNNAFSANLVLANGVVTNAGGGVITVAGIAGSRTIGADLVNNGAININNGFSLSLTKVGGVYTNAGTINAQNGLTVAAGSFTNLAVGTITNGTLTIAAGASLFGLGTITTNVTNNGQLNAGTSPGLFTITGNYSQASTGNFNVEIGGLTAGTQFDRVVTTGSAFLSGALTVSLIGGFTPAVGDSFQIMTFASRSGTFSPANGLDLPGPLRFRTDYTNTSLTLVVESEPTFSISGRVSNLNDTPLAGITLTLSGGQAATAQTDALGLYAFPSLPATLNYTVTPSQPGFTFNPANRAFTNLSANQTANFVGFTGPSFTISGRVSNLNDTPLAGITLTLSGGLAATAQTDALGLYAFPSLPATLNYTVTPSQPGFTFNPANRAFTNLSANQTANFVGFTGPSFTISGRVSNLNDSPLAGITLTLSGGLAATAQTDALGLYAFPSLPATLNYTVTPSQTGFTFNPANRAFTNLSANQTANFVGFTGPTFMISGRVSNLNDSPLAGITLTLSGGLAATAQTDALGLYAFPSLAATLNYTVTPSQPGFTFIPANRAFTNLSANQTANFVGFTGPSFMISGRVSDLNDSPLAGITLTLSGGLAATAQTDALGLYAFPTLPATLNYTVTPSQPGFTFNPANRAFTNLSANQTANFIAATGVFRRFFAEGATGAFFDTLLGLLNATDTPANVTLRFLKGDGTNVNHPMTIPPLTRATLDVETIGGMNAAEFSTVVESDVPVISDRTMRWDQDGYGSHAETSIAGAATKWYFAEGATISGFNLFYLVQNANPTAAQVKVTYLLPAPQAPIVKTHIVGPNSRYNIWVNLEHPLLDDAEVSAVVEVTNNVPVIVERAMYLDSGGLLFGAGHESAGVLAPATDWFLAEGATGPFFDLFILLANPNSTNADVEVRYLLPNGSVLTRQYVSAANSRFNIWVDFDHPLLADTAVSATIRSLNGVGIIVERAMWWPGAAATWHEGHNSAGATSTGTKWGLADGELGGQFAVETYVLIANTSAAAGQARVTLLFEDGTRSERTFPLSANSRFNVNMAAEFPAAVGRRFGTIVESIGATPAQIVVERAMYSRARDVFFAAGTNVVGTKLR